MRCLEKRLIGAAQDWFLDLLGSAPMEHKAKIIMMAAKWLPNEVTGPLSGLFVKEPDKYPDVERFKKLATAGCAIETSDGGGEVVFTLAGEFFGRPSGWNSAIRDNRNLRHVTLKICSPGGSAEALDMVEELRATGAHVRAEIGFAFSAAAILAQAGHERVMNSGGAFMTHPPVGTIIGNAVALRREADSLDETNKRMISLLSQRTRKPLEEVVAWVTGNDVYMTAEDALQRNLIDCISDEAEIFLDTSGKAPELDWEI